MTLLYVDNLDSTIGPIRELIHLVCHLPRLGGNGLMVGGVIMVQFPCFCAGSSRPLKDIQFISAFATRCTGSWRHSSWSLGQIRSCDAILVHLEDHTFKPDGLSNVVIGQIKERQAAGLSDEAISGTCLYR